MRNVTISMSAELHQKARVDAAKAGMSMSKYITEILSSAKFQVDRERDDRLEIDLACLRAVFDGPELLRQKSAMPAARACSSPPPWNSAARISSRKTFRADSGSTQGAVGG